MGVDVAAIIPVESYQAAMQALVERCGEGERGEGHGADVFVDPDAEALLLAPAWIYAHKKNRIDGKTPFIVYATPYRWDACVFDPGAGAPALDRIAEVSRWFAAEAFWVLPDVEWEETLTSAQIAPFLCDAGTSPAEAFKNLFQPQLQCGLSELDWPELEQALGTCVAASLETLAAAPKQLALLFEAETGDIDFSVDVEDGGLRDPDDFSDADLNCDEDGDGGYAAPWDALWRPWEQRYEALLAELWNHDDGLDDALMEAFYTAVVRGLSRGVEQAGLVDSEDGKLLIPCAVMAMESEPEERVDMAGELARDMTRRIHQFRWARG